MGRHRQPRELAELKGAVRKHPGRYRAVVPPCDVEIGGPPEHMAASAAAAWRELESYSLRGVLKGSDRLMLEIAANLVAEFRADPGGMMSSRVNILVGCLARLGLSPADRQRLGVPPEAAPNEFDIF